MSVLHKGLSTYHEKPKATEHKKTNKDSFAFEGTIRSSLKKTYTKNIDWDQL